MSTGSLFLMPKSLSLILSQVKARDLSTLKKWKYLKNSKSCICSETKIWNQNAPFLDKFACLFHKAFVKKTSVRGPFIADIRLLRNHMLTVLRNRLYEAVLDILSTFSFQIYVLVRKKSLGDHWKSFGIT